MKYFFDTEFIENGHTIELLSIGIVSERGKELYLENSLARIDLASSWVRENVFPHMLWSDKVSCTTVKMRKKILKFVGEDKKPQFWAYYADYDWVAFCQIFGMMTHLPKHFPMYCMDFKQWLVMRDMDDCLVKARAAGMEEHNALNDARWLRDEFERLTTQWRQMHMEEHNALNDARWLRDEFERLTRQMHGDDGDY